MEELFKKLLQSIGQTGDPKRAAKAFAHMTSGYTQRLADITKDSLQPVDTAGMVIIRDLPLLSLCEHHLVPFSGRVSIGYIPARHVMGLGRIAKVVDMFARRLQVQERLGQQICDALEATLKPKGIGVLIEAEHLCMRIGGEPRADATVVTSVVTGLFKEDAKTREEFLRLAMQQKS